RAFGSLGPFPLGLGGRHGAVAFGLGEGDEPVAFGLRRLCAGERGGRGLLRLDPGGVGALGVPPGRVPFLLGPACLLGGGAYGGVALGMDLPYLFLGLPAGGVALGFGAAGGLVRLPRLPAGAFGFGQGG